MTHTERQLGGKVGRTMTFQRIELQLHSVCSSPQKLNSASPGSLALYKSVVLNLLYKITIF